MGRRPCCAKEGLNRGAWSVMEDRILSDYIDLHGEGKWRDLPEKAGLKRCGKSCRLRWLNYLRPDIRRGNISSEEEDLIVRLHNLLGNRWALIAGRLPGRTDNEIKNYWNTNLRKRSVQSSNNNVAVPEKPSLGPPDRIIRTKAFRCTKVVNIISTPIITRSSSVDDGQIINPESQNNCSPLDLQEQDCGSDFLADFNINELLNMSDELISSEEESSTTLKRIDSCITVEDFAVSGDDYNENGKEVIMSGSDSDAFQPTSYEGFDHLNELSRFLNNSEGDQNWDIISWAKINKQIDIRDLIN